MCWRKRIKSSFDSFSVQMKKVLIHLCLQFDFRFLIFDLILLNHSIDFCLQFYSFSLYMEKNGSFILMIWFLQCVEWGKNHLNHLCLQFDSYNVEMKKYFDSFVLAIWFFSCADGERSFDSFVLVIFPYDVMLTSAKLWRKDSLNVSSGVPEEKCLTFLRLASVR